MKQLLLLGLVLSHFVVSSQNLIYLERLNNYTDFTAGNGQVNVQLIGVSPSLNVYVKYDQNIGGNPISTGWINHTGVPYTDVYGTGFSAVGVYGVTGDTMITAHQEFSATNYEIASVTASGFDAYGQYDILQNPPWTLDITYTGPGSSCDAQVQTMFGPVTAVNNVLSLSNVSVIFPIFFDPIYCNGVTCYNSLLFTDTIAGIASYPTGTLLNAYIPRVTNRPATILDCNGVIDFDRIAMVGDVSLEYSINGSAYTSFSNDQLTGLCAYDTIEIIGFSPTVLTGDTLVETSYVLRSADSLGTQIYMDLENVNMSLNTGVLNPENCLNKLDFNYYLGNPVGNVAYVLTELEEYITLDFSWTTGLDNMCQGKYDFLAIDDNYNTTGNFSFTILDNNNQLQDFLYDLDITPEFEDTMSCTTDIHITRPTGPVVSSYITNVQYAPSGGAFSQVGTANQTSFSTSATYVDLCPGLYLFESPEKSKYTIVTDSMQQLTLVYEEVISLDNDSDGYDDTYVLIPDVDTVLLVYEECTNNYSQPFNTIVYNMTTPQSSSLDISAGTMSVFVLFDEFLSGFDLTQNGNSITLMQRDVLVPSYYYLPNQYPYYVIAELYCDTTLKKAGSILRRRIVIEPNGQIHDEYGASLGLDDDLSDMDTKDGLKIYPNPTSTTFSVNNSGAWNELRVYDLNGKIIHTKDMLAEGSVITVDMTGMQKGTYIVEVSGNGNKQRRLLVKM